VHCDGRQSAGAIKEEQLVSKTEDHSQEQHGRHHRGQRARFGITRTTRTVSALAGAAVMALVGTANLAQAHPDDDGGGVRAAPAPPPVVELLSRGSVAKPFRVRAQGIELDADQRIDVAVAHLTFQPGGSTGWHRHRGPTVVTITTGELTIIDHRCRSRTYEAGDTFVEPGPPRHVAVNTADTTTETIVTFFVPRGAPALTIPAAAPRCAD
jgi:quercetin dioxygenase-like cupin family protein